LIHFREVRLRDYWRVGKKVNGTFFCSIGAGKP
jgi:hypothetical protein